MFNFYLLFAMLAVTSFFKLKRFELKNLLDVSKWRKKEWITLLRNLALKVYRETGWKVEMDVL